MANANPSRPGVNASAGKLQINIPKDQKVVQKADGTYVRRTEFESGTIRETKIFPGDQKISKSAADPAKSAEELRAEIREELRAEIREDIKSELAALSAGADGAVTPEQEAKPLPSMQSTPAATPKRKATVKAGK